MTLFLRFRRKSKSFFLTEKFQFLMKASCINLILVFASIGILNATNTMSQILEKPIEVGMRDGTLEELLNAIKVRTDASIAFLPSEIVKVKGISFERRVRTVRETLDLALAGTSMRYKVDADVIMIFNEAGTGSFDHSINGLTSDQLEIHGKIVDQNGDPIPGVNVFVTGTTKGTSTDARGQYVLKVPDDAASLTFSFIGFKTMEVTIDGRTMIDVVLTSDITSLQEVVISGGYYSTTDRMKTGTVVKVTSADISRKPVTNPLMALQGKVPGLNITPYNGVPGGALKVQIRGQNSLRPNGSLPLYIVDGVPIDANPIRTSSQSILLNGTDPLSTIDPDNIESIEVLKDGDATAIYGSRGANGVILITTKKGDDNSKSTLDLNYYRGVGRAGNTLELLNTGQYLKMRREAFQNDGAEPGLFDFDVNGTWDTTRHTKWQKELLGGTAQVSDLGATFSGSAGGTHFTVGLGHHKESTIFPGSFGLNQLNAQFGLNHSSTDRKLNITFSAQYGVKRTNMFDDLNFVSEAITLPPNAPALYNEAGELNWEIVSLFGGIYKTNSFGNPLALLKRTHDVKENTLIVGTSTTYRVAPGVNLNLRVGYNDQRANDISKFPLAANSPTSIYPTSTASATFSSTSRSSWIVEPYISYTKQFGQHNLNAVFGATVQNTNHLFSQIAGYGFASDVLLESPLGATDRTYSQDDAEYRYVGIYTRLGYDWKNKIIVNLTGRRDGSSRFGPGNRYGNFGAVGAAWIISEERFLQAAQPFLSFAKIRSSVGITGNDQIGDYEYLDTYLVSQYKYQGGIGLNPTSLLNPNLQWEQTRKIELSLELGFLNDKLFVESNWFRNRSSNQLVRYGLPDITGFQDVQSNLNAVIQNQGWEVLVNAYLVNSGFFKWKSSMNLTFPKNTLLSYDGIEESSYADLYKVGEPLTIQRLYISNGVNSATGEYEVADLNGDGSIDERNDKVFSSPTGRTMYGGLTNSFTFGRFDLTFVLQYSRSKDIGAMPVLAAGAKNLNQPSYVENRWRVQGDVTNVAKYTQNYSDVYNYYRESDANIVDINFLRVKSLMLSYDLSPLIIERLRMKRASLYIQGQNLFTFSNYDEVLDPETGISLPPLVMVSLGAQIQF